MKPAATQTKQAGFTLLEMMVSVAIFVVISGAIFGLLDLSQKRYQTESQLLDTFQEGRLGLDQIVRDVSNSGFPPANHFTVLPAVGSYTQSPVAWSPNYPLVACQVGVTCITPGPFDVILEEDYDGSGVVRWVRYQLVGTTLMRGVAPKVAGGGSCGRHRGGDVSLRSQRDEQRHTRSDRCHHSQLPGHVSGRQSDSSFHVHAF